MSSILSLFSLAAPLFVSPAQQDMNAADVFDRIRVLPFLAEELADTEAGLRFVGMGNADSAVSEAEVELFAAEGPGILGRLMLVNPSGTLRFYVDGGEQPSYEIGAREFFARSGPFEAPLVMIDQARGICRAPIPFQSSLRVTTTQVSPRFEAGIHRLQDGTKLPSFSTELINANRQQVTRLAREIAGSVDVARYRDVMATGVCDRAFPFRYPIVGNGVVHAFTIQFISADRIQPEELADYLRSMRIEIVDSVKVAEEAGGESSERVLASVPFGDFFGSAPGAASWRSDLLAVDERAQTFTCRIPIPYRDGFELRLLRLKPMEKQIRLKLNLSLEQLLEPPALSFRAGYFQKRDLDASKSGAIELGELKGPGRLTGLVMTGRYDGAEPWDRGQVQLQVDGQTLASSSLPSTEFFDRTTRKDGPLSFGYTSRNRFWVHDPVVFKESVKLAFQPAVQEQAKLSLEGVAYWYASADEELGFAVPEDGDAIAPQPAPVMDLELQADRVEAESLSVSSLIGSGELKAVEAGAFDGSSGGALHWQGGQDGEFARLVLDLSGADAWQVKGRFWCYPGGPTLQLSVGGQTIGGGPISLHAEEAGWKLLDLGKLSLKPRAYTMLLGLAEGAAEGPGVVFDYLEMKVDNE